MAHYAITDQTKIRRLIWRILPKRVHELGAHILNAYTVVKAHGWGVYRDLYRPPGANEVQRSVVFKGYPSPIYFRPGSQDVNTLVQTIVREEYGRFPAEAPSPKLIIDGGAYIGDTAIYFLNRFPDCIVLALEPDEKNCHFARKNLQPYAGRVFLLQKGLWSSNTVLSISGAYTGVNTKKDVENPTERVEGITIESLINIYGFGAIDLLKLDIEGAEEEVLLMGSNRWLDMVRMIVVEFHHAVIEKRCVNFLLNNGFKGYRYRSLYYFFK